VGQVLVAEEQDLVLGHGLVKLILLAVGDGAAQIDPEHLRANPKGDRPHLDAVIGHEGVL